MKHTLTALIAIGYCGVGAGAGAQTVASDSSNPGTDLVQLTPQNIVDALRRQLPIELEDAVVISQADVKSNLAVELSISVGYVPNYLNKKPEQVWASTAAKAATIALCRTGAIASRYLTGHHVIYLDIPSAKQGPARYKITGETCSNKYPRPVAIAMPMHELLVPAVVKYSGKPLPTTFNSCDDWEGRLSVVKPNNEWLINYQPPLLVKGEFETTRDYELRQSAQQKVYVNLAIPIDPEGLSYNADNSTMRISLREDATLRRVTLVEDSYVGSNAFGATMSVERLREKITAVEFRNPRAVLPNERYISMNIETAKAMKSRGVIRVLGTFLKHTETLNYYIKPSLDDPRDEAATHSNYLVEPHCVAVIVDGKKITDWQEF